MNDKIRGDIQKVFWKGTQFLEDMDSNSLKNLSNNTIHNASIYQDKDSVTIAVIIYAISKIIDRIHEYEIKPELIELMKEAGRFLENKEFQNYFDTIKDIVDLITKIDTKMTNYFHHIINEAGIKKGSRIYEKEFSLAKTAEIFGITQWELMKYVGQTKIAEEFSPEVDIKTRMKTARKIFNIKVS